MCYNKQTSGLKNAKLIKDRFMLKKTIKKIFKYLNFIVLALFVVAVGAIGLFLIDDTAKATPPTPANINDGSKNVKADNAGDDVLITVDADNLRHFLIKDKALSVCGNSEHLAHIYETAADTWTGECVATTETASPGVIKFFNIDSSNQTLYMVYGINDAGGGTNTFYIKKKVKTSGQAWSDVSWSTDTESETLGQSLVSADVALDANNKAVVALTKSGVDDLFVYYDSDGDLSFATQISEDHSSVSGAGIDFEKVRIVKHTSNNTLAIITSRLGATDGDFLVWEFDPTGVGGLSYLENDDNQWSATQTTYLGQTFTTPRAGAATQIDLKLWRQSYHTDGNVIVELYATSASKPTGVALCSGTLVLNTITVNAPGDWEEVTMVGCPNLTADTMYAIVVHMSDTDWVFWRRDATSATYSGGGRVLSTNSGVSWSTVAGQDHVFEVHLDTTAISSLAGDDDVCDADHCGGASLAYDPIDDDLVVLFGEKYNGYIAVQAVFDGSTWTKSDVTDFSPYVGVGVGNTEIQIASDGTYKAVMTEKTNSASSPYVVALYGEKASGGSWSFASAWEDVMGYYALGSSMYADNFWVAGTVAEPVANLNFVYSTTDYSANTAPVISDIAAAQQTDDGYVDVTYILTDADDESDISLSDYEYTANGAEWNVMEPVAGDGEHDGVSSLTGSPGGTEHTFVWVPCNDWDTYEDSVSIRLTPHDGDTAGDTATIASPIAFDCAAPVVSNVTASQTPGSNDIVISYDVSDDNSTNLTVELDISDDRGRTWDVTNSSVSGNIGAGQKADVGKSITWDAGTDYPGEESSSFKVRVRVTDQYQNESTAQASDIFSVDTQGPAGLANFAWSSDTSESVDLVWDSGVSDANFDHYELWWGTVQNDVENRQGTASEWDNDDDNNLANASTVGTTITGLSEGVTYYVKIWAIDSHGNESSVSAVTQSTNNKPIVSNISGAQQTDDGDINISYSLSDNDSGNVDMALYQYSTDGASWSTMTAATGDVAHEGLSPLTALAGGSDHVFVWDACTDLGNVYESTVFFKLQVNDGNENGEAIDTAGGSGIAVDCALPVISNLNAAQTVNTDTVVVTYDLADDNSTSLIVELDISEDGGSTWTVTDTSVTSSVGTGQTTGSSKTISWDAGTDFALQEQADIQIRVRAKDKYQNQGDYAASASFIVDTKNPTDPGDLTESSSTASSATLAFGAAATDTNFTEYKIYYSTTTPVTTALGTAHTSSTDANLGSINFNSGVNTTISGLNTNIRYYFKIFAYDSLGHSASSSEVAVVTRAAVPSGLSLTSNESNSTITVSWQANGNPAGTEYYVANASTEVNSGWQTGLNYNFNLSVYSDYTFTVKARNLEGVETSVASLAFSALPSPGTAMPPAFSQPPRSSDTADDSYDGFLITINNGATHTASRLVNLVLDGGPDAVSMAISEKADFAGASIETYAASKNFTLSEGDGQKTVYVKFYTAYGVTSHAVSDSITLDSNFVIVSPVIISPAEGTDIKELPFTVSGTGLANAYITVEIAGSVYSVEADGRGNFTVQILDLLIPGAYSIKVKQMDTSGAESGQVKRTIYYQKSSIKGDVNVLIGEPDQELPEGMTIPEEGTETPIGTEEGVTTPTTPVGTGGQTSQPPAVLVGSPTIEDVTEIIEQSKEKQKPFLLVLRGQNTTSFFKEQINSIYAFSEEKVEIMLRPEKEAHSIVARLYPLSPDNFSGNLNVQKVSLWEKIKSLFVPSIALAQTENSDWIAGYVFDKFEGTDIYSGNIEFPDLAPGLYKLVVTVNGSDGSRTHISKLVQFLEKGGIYARQGIMNAKKGIDKAKITVYQWQPDGYKIWYGSSFGQNNPIFTNERGKYAAHVPAGQYYITVDAPQYESYESGIYAFSQPDYIRKDVELIKKKSNLWYSFWAWFGQLIKGVKF